jgi:hypothetical protein
MTNELNEGIITLDSDALETLWEEWFGPDDEDVLARAAFERSLRVVAGLEDEGLYFRPGGWSIDLPATIARTVCAAAILAALFELAGLHDVDREILISTAGLITAMDVSPVRLNRQERRLADQLRQANMTGTPISAEEARSTLPRSRRRKLDSDVIADALDRLVAAGFADSNGDGTWVVRAQGSEAWFRLHLGSRFD